MTHTLFTHKHQGELMSKRFNRQQRTTARLALVQKFFASKHGEGVDCDASLLGFFNSNWEKPDMDFIKNRYRSITENLAVIEENIESGLQNNWKSNQLDKVLHALMVVATDEMIATHATTPPEILIKEYADLAGDFFDSPEVSFINAYLNALKEKVTSKEINIGMH